MNKNRIVQLALGLLFLGLLVQIVLIAPVQIRDSDAKRLLPPPPSPAVKAGSASSGGQEKADQSMQGMHMIETQEGEKDWELWSDQATSLKTEDRMELENVKAVFFAKDGVTFTVTGKKGIVKVKTKDLRVEGNVVTQSSKGGTFRTHSVEYTSQGRVLTSKDPVEMVGPPDAHGYAMTLTGVGLRAIVGQKTVEVLRDVKAERMMENERKVLIRSQSALFNSEERFATFSGDVVMDMDTMRMTGPLAKFDYDPLTEALKTIHFSGGSRVSDTDKWATAQNVRVDVKENKFTFYGQPRVVQNNDELRGEEIVFLDGGKQVQVRRARAKVDEKRLEAK